MFCFQELYESDSEEEPSGGEEEDQEEEDGDGGGLSKTNGLVDMEDLGKVVNKMKKAKVGFIIP